LDAGGRDGLDQGQFSVPDYDAATSFLRDRAAHSFCFTLVGRIEHDSAP
jgi:hypothetical protein